jgi:hypothetical protein
MHRNIILIIIGMLHKIHGFLLASDNKRLPVFNITAAHGKIKKRGQDARRTGKAGTCHVPA